MAQKRAEEAFVFDAEQKKKLAETIANLTDEQREMFLFHLEASIKKRRVQLLGYLLALLVTALGMLFALLYYGTHDGFVGWVFLVPIGGAGLVLYLFGMWTERMSKKAKAVRIRTASAPLDLPSDPN